MFTQVVASLMAGEYPWNLLSS